MVLRLPPHERKNKMIPIRFKDTEYAILKKIADADDRSVAYIIRKLLTKVINPTKQSKQKTK